jgi:hypothetical protein
MWAMRPAIVALFLVVVWVGSALWSPAQTTPQPAAPTPRGAVPAGPEREAPAAAALRPFTAFSWHFPGHGLPHIKPMLVMPPNGNFRLVGLAARRLEPGTRVVLNTHTMSDLIDHPRDVCRDRAGNPTTQMGVWPEFGTELVRDRWQWQLQEIAAAGGEIDHVVVDYENGYSCWVMSEARLQAIGADPRWPDLARELGFADPLLALFERRRDGSYLRWNAVTHRTIAQSLERSMFTPLRRQFGKAGMSCYGFVARHAHDALFDINGHPSYSFDEVPGSHQSPALYGFAPSFPNVPADFSKPFAILLYSTNDLRNCLRASNRPILPWVAFRSSMEMPGRPSPLNGTDWWQEHTYHVALNAGTDNLLFFNPGRNGLGPPSQSYTRSSDNEAMNDVMAELQKQAGGKRFVRSAFSGAVPWDVKVLLSAVLLEDGSTLARVSFSDGVDSAEVTVAGVPLKLTRPPGKLGTWVMIPK